MTEEPQIKNFVSLLQFVIRKRAGDKRTVGREAKKMIFLEREEVIKFANEKGLFIVGRKV